MLSVRILWAVKILLVLHKASADGAPLVKSRELLSSCVGPGTDAYICRRTLRELVAKTDYVICVFLSGRTYYKWNENFRPTLHDLISQLEGGMHEATNTFWSYENTRTLQPLQRVCRQFDNHIHNYLSNIYIEELESPALSKQGRFRMSQLYPQAADGTEKQSGNCQNVSP